jgi:uncharacterized iron-regulated membrane protein
MNIAAGLRRLWLNVHLWLGVALFIPVVLIGLTGTVLTFHEELERAVFPARYEVTSGVPAPATELLHSAQAAVGEGFAVTSLRFEGEGEPALAQARSKGRPAQGAQQQRRNVYLDPATARVLDMDDPRGGFFGISHRLHGSLMIPENGRKIVGWIGWGLLISSLTGIWLWWPRGGAFARAFHWKRGRLFTFNLHHMAGFWISIPLAILAATGVYISFPQSARALSVWVLQTDNIARPGGGGPRGGGSPLAETTLTADDVAAIARATAPDARLSLITLPTEARGDDAPSWRVEVRESEEADPIQMTIEDRAGAQANVREQGSEPLNLALLMRRLHDGVDYPLWWRILIALGGAAPTILGVTGIIMWLRKNKNGAPA